MSLFDFIIIGPFSLYLAPPHNFIIPFPSYDGMIIFIYLPPPFPGDKDRDIYKYDGNDADRPGEENRAQNRQYSDEKNNLENLTSFSLERNF